jgi:hypothetical protein
MLLSWFSSFFHAESVVGDTEKERAKPPLVRAPPTKWMRVFFIHFPAKFEFFDLSKSAHRALSFLRLLMRKIKFYLLVLLSVAVKYFTVYKSALFFWLLYLAPIISRVGAAGRLLMLNIS